MANQSRKEVTASKAEERRTDIVNRAALLLDRRGVDQVSMTDIAEEVGLAKPSLYHYFASKDEILYSIHVNTIEPLLSGLRARIAAQASPDVMLRGILSDLFELMDDYPGHIRVFFESSRRLPPEFLEPVRKREREYDELVMSVIEQGIREGYYRGIDPRTATLALFGMANWSYQWYQPGGPVRGQEFAERFYDIFVNGVTARQR
ncbi:hypothetical protein AD006_32165 (plasmid) [Pseudonocardia sp. EC080610-09]|uniref:TetR/AcrR family transcriptional regulator n=1 Tax=unclassified Pseudonocardia TaxID=2619320 RepID=UPI000705BCE2|nr:MULTISPECIES: TetR/AcrR family transcriptional regulator [unclassified Pseudonocardia]ALL79243.1 hypothetical protein AD006_28305 [Pseudonocardia sp. EC080610-09]ALL79777.1 hypothetical protein AD006_32165 [Pseudonocardia sp. EC080610-09]ALL85213.1 hypothetical protein AD017_28695 [Pseudonocardia sp. EC080619-01]